MLIKLIQGLLLRSECKTKSRYEVIIVPLIGWKCSNILEQPEQIKILFRKKFRAD